MKLKDILREKYDDERGDSIPNPLKTIPNAMDLIDEFDDIEHDYYEELDYINGYLDDNGKDSRPRNEQSATYRQDRKNFVTKFSKTTTLPIKDLITIEPDLDGKWIQKLKTSPQTKLPLIYEIRGNYIIIDGNHRVAAQLANNKSTVKVNLISAQMVSDEVDRLYKLRVDGHQIFQNTR